MKGRPLDLSAGTKNCPRCQQVKPLDEFHKSKATVHGYSVYCKPCGYARHKKWAEGRPDINAYRAAKSKEWRERNPRLAKDHKLKSTYGIALGTYERLLEKQSGKCAICKTEDGRGKGDFHVDHCHDTGRIRGLLCHGCNVGIGSLKHDPEVLHEAIRYLSTEGCGEG